MITQIKGRLVEKSPTELVIDCNGLGYLVNISLNTFSLLSDSENISLQDGIKVLDIIDSIKIASSTGTKVNVK